MNLNRKNLDVWYHRNSIHKFIEKSILDFNGIVLDVGCGRMPYKNIILEQNNVTKYIGLDIETAIDYGGEKADILWINNRIPLDDQSVDSILCTEVLEHIFDLNLFLLEIRRVLRPEGKAFFTIPFLWPLHEVPHDAHRLTPWMVNQAMTNSGFKNINIYALGGWHAALGQMLGLWVKRSGLNKYLQFILSFPALLICKFLFYKDRPIHHFNESTMITGLAIEAC